MSKARTCESTSQCRQKPIYPWTRRISSRAHSWQTGTEYKTWTAVRLNKCRASWKSASSKSGPSHESQPILSLRVTKFGGGCRIKLFSLLSQSHTNRRLNVRNVETSLLWKCFMSLSLFSLLLHLSLSVEQGHATQWTCWTKERSNWDGSMKVKLSVLSQRSKDICKCVRLLSKPLVDTHR